MSSCPLVPALLALSLVSLVSAPHPAHAQTVQAAQKPVLTTLHRLSNTDGHGTGPTAALTLGPDGNFYGTTEYGGAGETGYLYSGNGTVFVMTPAGQVTTLYKFPTAFDGANPYAGVAFGPDGALYGSTSGGGAKSGGTIFKLTLLPQNVNCDGPFLCCARARKKI